MLASPPTPSASPSRLSPCNISSPAIERVPPEVWVNIFDQSRFVAKTLKSARAYSEDRGGLSQGTELITLGADPVVRAVCKSWKAVADENAMTLWNVAGLVCDKQSSYLVTYRGYGLTYALCQSLMPPSTTPMSALAMSLKPAPGRTPSITLFFSTTIALRNLCPTTDRLSEMYNCHDFPLANRPLRANHIAVVAPYVKNLIVRGWSEYWPPFDMLTTAISSPSWPMLENIDMRTRLGDYYYFGQLGHGQEDDPMDRKTIWGGKNLKRINTDIDEDLWQGSDCLHDVVARRPWTDLQSLITRSFIYPIHIRDLIRHSQGLEVLVCGVRFHDALAAAPEQMMALLSEEVINHKLRKLHICGASGWIGSDDPLYLNQLFIHGKLILPGLLSFAVSVDCSVEPALDWILHGEPKPSIRELQVVGTRYPASSKIRTAMRQLPNLEKFGFEGGAPCTRELLLEIVGNAKEDGSPCSAGPPMSLREVHLYSVDSSKMSLQDMFSFMCRLCAYGNQDDHDARYLLQILDAQYWDVNKNTALRDLNVDLGERASILIEQVSGLDVRAPFEERTRERYIGSEGYKSFLFFS